MSWSELEPYGDVLSVCGALVIFFSWVVNNTIQERFKEAAASAGELRESFLLFEGLRELAGSIESISGIALNLSSDITGVLEMLRSPGDRADRSAWFEQNRKILEVAASKVNARQIDAGIAFCALALRTAGEVDSTHAKELQRLLDEMTTLRYEKEQVFAAADEALNEGDDPRPHLSQVRDLVDGYGPLLRSATDSVNTLLASRAVEADRLRLFAKWARRAALTMYAIGSVLAVAGTALTKL